MRTLASFLTTSALLFLKRAATPDCASALRRRKTDAQTRCRPTGTSDPLMGRTMPAPPRSENYLPARGNMIITITVVDENGFTHHYAPIETRAQAVHQAVAFLNRKPEAAPGSATKN